LCEKADDDCEDCGGEKGGNELVDSFFEGGYQVPDNRDRCSGDEAGSHAGFCGSFPVEGEKKGRPEGCAQSSPRKQDEPEDQFFCNKSEHE